MSSKANPNLLHLPDELLHKIFTFVANSPVLIGPSLCWNLRSLSSQWQQSLDSRNNLWNIATQDLACDYYNINICNIDKMKNNSSSIDETAGDKTKKAGCKRQRTTDHSTTSTRRSTRLRPATPKESYIHSHNLLLSRTEGALLELTEHCHSSKTPLSLSFLQRLLREHEPIAINQRVRTGGTFLVELCRARHVSERVILSCIKLLIGRFGANPNVPSAESTTATSATITISSVSCNGGSSSNNNTMRSSTSMVGKELYPIVIAAARGMSTVVSYLLLSAHANPNVRGSSRFRLFSNQRKSVKGVDLTALEFAVKMKEGEVENGAKKEDLKGLEKVISILQKNSKGAN